MSKKSISKEHEQFLLKVKREKRNILLTQIGVFVLGLLIWEVSARFKLIDTFLTSSPSAILKLIVEYTLRGRLFHHITVSVLETIAGFTIGTLLGMVIAIGLWWSDFWSRVLDPYLVVLNSLPKTALAPIIIIWVGAGYSGIISNCHFYFYSSYHNEYAFKL
ncbi:alkanesulfonate transporter permease subunit [Tissierella creatinophila DSM 6911]|uniref:Alkanesulfonate transporter permease subunit n=2 Tax=Tissierella creatinophila TaxID=79681 RepID=A0A1U7M994_TISCR|nr:alkanesulfonate transporter permease subunit [Tissierella creatinophila DSM 6911]